MSRAIRLAIALVLLAWLGSGAAHAPKPAQAAEAMVRVGLHDDYGRLVIEWPAPVELRTEREGAGLSVRASRPFPARLEEVTGRLHRYLASLELDAGGDGLAIQPTTGVDIAFELLDERLLVLDFRAAAPELRLRVGQHPGFVRLVFEPVIAPPRLQRTSEGLEIDLPGPISAWALGRLQEVPGVTVAVLDGHRLKLGLAAAATARDQRVAPDKLVIDVSPPVHTAVGDGTEDVIAAGQGPAFPLPRVRPVPAAAAAEVPAPAEADPADLSGPVPDDAPSEPPAPVGPPVEGPVVITGTRLGGGSAEIAFRWTGPVPAAVFIRGGSLWAVFGAEASVIEIDAEAFATAVGRHVTGLRRERHGSATVLRLTLAGERSALVHRDAASWVVTLRPLEEADEPNGAPALTPLADGLLLPGVTSIATLIDPVVGDRLGVGLAIAPTGPRHAESRFVGLRLLPSAQGAVWRPLAEPVETDDLTEGGVLLTAAHGVLPTSVLPAVATAATTEPAVARLPMEEPAPSPADSHAIEDNAEQQHEMPEERQATDSSPPSPLGLARFAADDFRTRRLALTAALTAADGTDRDATRLDLARLLVVNGLGAEALELLDAATIESDAPEAMPAPDEAALTGAALLLMDRPGEAADWLADQRLAADGEIALWRGAAAGATGAWDQGLGDWERGAEHLETYPLDLQAVLALPGVRLLLETGRADAAFALIDRLAALDLRPDRLRSLRRLEATALERDGATQEALAAWRALAGTGPIEERAVARAAATSLALAAGELSLEEAIATLEADRRYWRGQQEEFALWRQLAGLQGEAGRIDEALDTLRAAMHRLPPPAEAEAITGEMAAFFGTAMDELAAGERSPTSALLLYRRFAELMPVGPEGDEAAATLSAALLATGLATAGTEILDDRLEIHAERDARRARLGLMLARLHVASGAPDRALATLVDSTPLGAVDAALTADRQELMAEALAANSASATLTDGPAAGLLKARAAFDAGDWPAVRLAAMPLEATLPETGPLDAEAGEVVLMLATAARQLGDAEAARQLARRHAERLPGERDAALLGLLAGLPTFAGDTDRVLADATRHLHEARDVLAVLGRH